MQDMDPKPIRLTQTVKKGGCAAKLPAGELKRVLGRLQLQRPQQLIIGSQTLDDAAVWDLGGGHCLVQTLDFFTPIVDDPFDFGAIAAANALSDVYAMGARPATALTILGFPAATLDMTLLDPIMQGAMSKIHAAGACLAGGHSIENDALILGFSIAGFVSRDGLWSNAGARIGDTLILTKGLGTGTITSGLKYATADPSWVQAAVDSMTQLNAIGSLVEGARIHAATDVTGYSLAGHAMQMATASGVCIEIDTRRIPALDGAMESLEAGSLNRAHHTNLDYVRRASNLDEIDEPLKWLLVDPQTSGGLLLSVEPDDAADLLARLQASFGQSRIIGEVAKMADSPLRFLQ